MITGIKFVLKYWIKYIRDIGIAKKIIMPNIFIMPAGTTKFVGDAKIDTVYVMGYDEDGEVDTALTQGTTPVIHESFVYDPIAQTITVPDVGANAPTKYLVKYDREVKPGIKLRWNLIVNEFKLLYRLHTERIENGGGK